MPQGQIEDIKKNTGTAVPTEVSAQTVNPMQQPNINVNQQEVNAVAQGTQPTQPTQPTQQPQTAVSQTQVSSNQQYTEPTVTALGDKASQQGANALLGTQQMDLNDLNNADILLNELVQGYPVYGNGMAVDSARARYNDYKSLSAMSYKEIGDAILSGEVAKNGTTMSDLLKYNPQLFQQVRQYVTISEEVNNLNGLGDNLYQNYNGVETNDNYTNYTMRREERENVTDSGSSKSIITTYSDDIIDFIKSYQTNATQLMTLASSMLSNPTIQQYKNNILNLEGKIAQIQTDIEYVGDEAREMLGSSAPESLVSAYISQQTKHLQRQLMTYNNSLLVEQGKLDSAVDEVKTKLDYYMKGMDLGTDALQALMGGISGSSSSSSGLTTSDLSSNIGNAAINNIKKDILNGSFGWTTGALKKYGLSNVDIDEVLNSVAKALVIDEDADELLAIKNAVDDTNYQKILKKFISNNTSWLINTFKNNKSNLSDIATWLEGHGFSESQAKSLLSRAGYTTSEWNKIAKKLGWSEGTLETVTGTTAEAIKGLRDAMLDGTFGWKFSEEVLKKYGISGTSEDAILKTIASTLDGDDLLKIKKNASVADYNKILKAVLNVNREGFLNVLEDAYPRAGSDTTLYSVAQFMKDYGIDRDTGMSLLEEAGYDLDERNSIANHLGWKQQTDSKTMAVGNKITSGDLALNQQVLNYVKTMNAASGGVKTITKSSNAGYDALLKGSFDFDELGTYGLSKGSGYGYLGQQIGGVASNYTEIAKLLNNAEGLEITNSQGEVTDKSEDNVNSFIDGIKQGYTEKNYPVWISAIKKIGNNEKNLKLYLTGILGKSYKQQQPTKDLLQQAGIDSKVIKSLLG